MKTASKTRRRMPAKDASDDLDTVHLDWSDIPPPKDIIRARRDGHVVRIPEPVLVIDSGESRVCFLGVALVGVLQGIFIPVDLALMALVWRAWHPDDAVLGRVDGLKGYHDISRHLEARRIPGLVLFRWDAPLFFANAEVFHDHVRAAVASAPTRTRWVVVAAEPVTDVDLTAADVLLDLDEDLRWEGIELCFAEMKGPVKDRLKRYGLFDQIGTESFFPTVGQAVDRYLEATGVAWVDWDEVAGPPKSPMADE